MIVSYQVSPLMITLPSVAPAGSEMLIPRSTVPPRLATVSASSAMVSVGPVPEPWLGLCKFSVTGSDVPVAAELASVAVNTLSPWLAKVTPADQLPLELTVAVPMAVVPSRIVTIEPASATSTVPAIVWLACETTPPPW